MSDIENADWLALPAGNLPVTRVRKPYPKWRVKFVEARRKLTLPQRAFLEQMIRNNFHLHNAWKATVADGYHTTREMAHKWKHKNKVMCVCLELAETHYLQFGGISAQKVLKRLDALAEHGDDMIEVRDRWGNIVLDANMQPVMMKRDPHLALKANELLGKNQRLWGDEDRSARVVVNIVDLTGRNEAADDRVIDVSGDVQRDD